MIEEHFSGVLTVSIGKEKTTISLEYTKKKELIKGKTTL
jgi:hypothetical protein